MSDISTFYSRDQRNEKDVFRHAWASGVDLSSKLYRPLDWQFEWWGTKIAQMRHILSPAVTYEYSSTPTTLRRNLIQFDEIDEFERQERVVLSLRNKLQARNAERTWDFLYFAPGLEYNIHREGQGSAWDVFRTDFEFYPVPALSVTADSRYDCRQGTLLEANADVGYRDPYKDKYYVALGHRYADQDTSQGTFNSWFQLTPKLRFNNYLRYEYRHGTAEQMQYSVRRDLHCWWFDLGVDVNREKNCTVWFKFTIKDFSDVSFGLDHSYEGAKRTY